jgi:nucleoside-diphosphate-sugar epimerase
MIGRMRVFLTGGSGFVGGRLIRTLTREGVAVTALARSEAAARTVAGHGGEVARGELGDVAALTAGMAGAEVVVHAAAKLTGGPREAAEYHRVNVDGTSAVLSAARAAGVARVVHVSTEQVVMGRGPLVRVDERAPYPDRAIGRYAATKQAAERLVRSAGGVVVRPRMVWGAGDTTLLPVLVDAARSGRLRWIGGGRQLTSTCHVDNVVTGIRAAAGRGRPGEVYFLTDGEPVVFREFWSDLLRSQGVTPPAGTLPRGVAMAAGAVVEGVWRALRRPGEPPLDRMKVALLADECTVDDSKARAELGYAPAVTVADGLAELRTAGAAA